ncbi:MAG: isoamylase early set domain-containing protein [Deltaproteobacteria bacterium]|nr:isoamylase early set domain-containing protein [Deltaproteobacteria bacterium]
MSIRKQYLKRKPICKVTFRIPEATGNSYETAHLVGEFNNWNLLSTPMKQLKTGAFTATIDLEKGGEYQFRYLLDKKCWENDIDADEFSPTPYGDSKNSVIIL